MAVPVGDSCPWGEVASAARRSVAPLVPPGSLRKGRPVPFEVVACCLLLLIGQFDRRIDGISQFPSLFSRFSCGHECFPLGLPLFICQNAAVLPLDLDQLRRVLLLEFLEPEAC